RSPRIAKMCYKFVACNRRVIIVGFVIYITALHPWIGIDVVDRSPSTSTDESTAHAFPPIVHDQVLPRESSRVPAWRRTGTRPFPSTLLAGDGGPMVFPSSQL